LYGEQACVIEHGSRIRFACQSKPLRSHSEAIAQRNASLARARACLDGRWQLQDRMAEHFVALNDRDASRAILFAVEQDIGGPAFRVRSQIYRRDQDSAPAANGAGLSRIPEIGGYCPALKTVLASGQHYFADVIRGVDPHRSARGAHWKAAISLPQWEECFVHEEGGRQACRYFTCMVGPWATADEAVSIMAEVAKGVRTCLGSDWRQGRSTAGGGAPSLLLVGGKNDDPYIEVRRTRSLDKPGWNVRLDVNLDLEACQPGQASPK
jgi:hypothetical protein